MNMEELMAFLQSVNWLGSRPGLGRITELLHRLDDPQKELRYVHVAGTNGKGSTAIMLASILTEAGYSTGLYTSPHLVRYNERMKIDGVDITDEDLCKVAAQVKICVDEMNDKPTEFELVTAMALLYFKQKNCGIVVLEVGLGGRLDATNVIPAPELAVITNIGLEHTEVLGDTIGKIAAEKGGIIKTGCACVCYDGAAEAMEVVKQICAEKTVPLTCVDFSRMTALDQGLDGQRFIWDNTECRIALLGPHQLHNAALALIGIDALRGKGWEISESAVVAGLGLASWPARMEVLNCTPLFILDGGHNPQCAQALARSLEQLFPGQKMIFLAGVLADKDYASIVAPLLPFAKEFICVTPDSPRALPATEFKRYLEAQGARANCGETIRDGVFRALESAGNDGSVVAFGSLYLAGEIRNCFSGELKRLQRKRCLNARRALTTKERNMYSAQICEKLEELPAVREAKVILSYIAMQDEVDLSEFNRWAVAQGKTVAYPISHDGGLMDAAVPWDENSLENGKFGILSPIADRSEYVCPEEVELVLTPCVGADRKGGRIGHGAGYYDKYLPLCRRAAVIAAAFEAQMIEEVCQEKTDRTMDMVVTERNIYHND